jgi:hypothetical protein
MNFDIQPYIGVANLRFEDTAESVIGKLSSFPFSHSVHDYDTKILHKYYFEDIDLMVGINGANSVEYFEFFGAPAIPVSLTYRQVDLFLYSYQNLIPIIFSWDPQAVIDYDTTYSFELGIGIGDPGEDDNPLANPASIIIFRRGHYDGLSIPQMPKTFPR